MYPNYMCTVKYVSVLHNLLFFLYIAILSLVSYTCLSLSLDKYFIHFCFSMLLVLLASAGIFPFLSALHQTYVLQIPIGDCCVFPFRIRSTWLLGI